MRYFKKLTAAVLSVIMALTMALGMSLPVSAANDGSITITNATVGETYYIYKVFDASYDASDPSAISYKISGDDNWYSLVSTAVVPGTTDTKLFTLTDKGTTNTGGYKIYYVTTDYQSSVITWFQSLDSANIPTATASGTATGSTLAFSGLEYGYYLVLSSLGTTVTLTSTNPNAEVIDKNQAPTMDSDTGKQIYDEDTTSWQTYNTEAVGNYVYYKLQVEATNYGGTTGEAQITQYIISDNWEAGLGDFDASNLVVLLSYDQDTTYSACIYNYAPDGTTLYTVNNLYQTLTTSDYTVTLNDSTYSTNDNFVLTIPWVDSSNNSLYLSPVTITVFYKLKVQDGALAVVNYNDGNLVNEMQAEYNVSGANTVYRIGTSYAFTVTYNIGLIKEDGNNTSKVLEGAEFTVTDSSGKTLYFIEESTLSGVYHYDSSYTAQTTGATSTVVTAENGRLVLLGLDADTYTLTETNAPNGYNPLATPITIEIEGTISGTSLQAAENNGELVIYYDTTTNKVLDNNLIGTSITTGYSSVTYYGLKKEVLNYTGKALPTTGGTGTAPFYVIGGILVLAAGLLLITKKRMGVER